MRSVRPLIESTRGEPSGSSAFSSFLAARSALAASRASRSSVLALASPLVHSTGAEGKQTEHRIEPCASTAASSVRPDSSGSQPNTVVGKQVEQFSDEWMWPLVFFTRKKRDQ